MIIYDGNLGRTSIGPTEDNAPLVVDSNGIMPRKFARQRLQVISGWHRHVPHPSGPIKLDEFAQSYASNRVESPVSLLPEKLLRIVI